METKKFKIVADTKGAEKGLSKTSKGLKDVSKSSSIAGKGFKMVGTALKGLGIGIIIAKVIGKLTEMLMSNQKVSDLVARAMDTLQKVLNIVIDIMFEALKVVDKLTFGMLNLSGETDGASKSLQRQRNEFELMEAGMEKIKLQYQNQIEQLRQVRDNEALTMQERIDANNQIAVILDEQHATEKARILEMIQVKKNLLASDKDNLELKKDLLAVETMLAELDERITGQRSEQLTNVNSLKREQNELSKRSTKAIKKEVKSVEEMVEALDKYGGKLQKTDEQIHNENLQNLEEEFYKNVNEIRGRNKRKRKTEFDDDIKDTKKIIKNQQSTLSKLYSQLGKTTDEARQKRIREDIAGYKENLNAQKRNLNLLQENREKDLLNQGAYSDDEQKLLDFYKKKKAELIKMYNKKEEDEEKKQQQKIQKINDDARALAREDLMTDEQRELLALKNKYQAILEQTELGEEERQAILDRYARDQEAVRENTRIREEEEEQEKVDFYINSAMQLANSLVQISASRTNSQIAQLEKEFKAGEITEKQFNKRKNALERKQAKKEKAAALLQISVDTARGIAGAIKAGSGLIFPANLAAITSGVLAVIGGMANASSILGATPEGIDSPTDDSGDLGVNASQTVTNTFGMIGAEPPPVQAFVVESDVSNAQSLADDLSLQATL